MGKNNAAIRDIATVSRIMRIPSGICDITGMTVNARLAIKLIAMSPAQ